MALVLKTSDVKASVGSNPTLSAPRGVVQFGRTFLLLLGRVAEGSNPFTPIV